MSLQQIQLRDLLLIVDWNIVDFRNWHDRNLPGQEIAIFFFNAQRSFFCIFQADTKLCYNFARIPDDHISQIHIIHMARTVHFKTVYKKAICLLRYPSLCTWMDFRRLNKCFPQWQEFFKHVLEEQLIFIAQNQNKLTFTWWIQSPFHLVLYNL